MTKILKIALLLLVATSLFANAQTTKKSDFLQQMKESVQDSTSNFYYSKLLKKIESNPGSVSEQEIYYLYYGQITLKKPKGLPMLMDDYEQQLEFRKAAMKGNKKKTLSLGLLLLKDNPAEITTLMHTLTALKELKKPDDNFLEKRFQLLLKAILSTGDGNSNETPIKIANVEDDYIIKGILNFKSNDEVIEQYNGVLLSVWKNAEGKLYFEDTWAYL